MTPCGYDYFRAINNPFDIALNPCIPSHLSFPTQKLKVLTRGVFQLGLDGQGGVAMWPWRGASNELILAGQNSLPFLKTSNATTTGGNGYYWTNTQALSTADTTVTGYPGTTSPYNTNDLSTDSRRSVKLVAAGVRVQYIDKVLDMSGSYIAWRNPIASNSLPADRDNVADLLRVNHAIQERVGSNWASVAYRPIAQGDLDSVNGMPTNLATPADRLACGVFVANGQAGARFEFEGVAYYEIAGPGTPLTPSYADPTTLGVVVSSDTGTIITNGSLNERAQTQSMLLTLRNMGYSAVETGGRVLGTAGRIVETANQAATGVALVGGVAAMLRGRARQRG